MSSDTHASILSTIKTTHLARLASEGGTKLALNFIRETVDKSYVRGLRMSKQVNNKNNVIDMTERMETPDARERLKHLKVRFDLEHAKIALSTSLLSVVVLVTLANRNLMNNAPTEMKASRGIASVSTGTSEIEDSLVRSLAKHELDSNSMGRQPSSIEALAFGQLEGKYAVRMANGKLAELEFSDVTSQGDRPKHIDDRIGFLDSHRDLLPVAFDKSIKIDSQAQGESTIETYQLINEVSRPVASVEFKLDAAGRLLSMRVAQLTVAAK